MVGNKSREFTRKAGLLLQSSSPKGDTTRLLEQPYRTCRESQLGQSPAMARTAFAVSEIAALEDFSGRFLHTDLSLRYHNETPRPCVNIFSLKEFRSSRDQVLATG